MDALRWVGFGVLEVIGGFAVPMLVGERAMDTDGSLPVGPSPLIVVPPGALTVPAVRHPDLAGVVLTAIVAVPLAYPSRDGVSPIRKGAAYGTAAVSAAESGDDLRPHRSPFGVRDVGRTAL